jgi:sensor histidine kinase YesM
MNWHSFIFSDERGIRTRRHLIFWLLWWLYFAATYYYYIQVGLQKIDFGNLSSILILKTSVLILVHILSCYAFLYVLLPRYLVKGKYISLLAGTTLLIGFLVVAGYIVHAEVFPFIDLTIKHDQTRSNSTVWWASINSVLLTAPKIIAAAVAIKLVKRWYLKQKEMEKVEKEKLVTDLQLLKAQVHPSFLFSSLDHIYDYAKEKSSMAQELLLKFSDLLSYLLYECDEVIVPLEKELTMMKEYMNMEKLTFGNNMEMEIDIKGRIGNKTIAPLLLLPFIENSFRHCSTHAEQSWINLEISLEENILTMKLMNGVDSDKPEQPIVSDEMINVQKRLQHLYPGSHALKMFTEQEICMTLLKINLTKKTDLQSVLSSTIFNNNQLISESAIN